MAVVAFSFVLEELQSFLSPDRMRVKAMFGSHGVYVDEKIVFILRDKANTPTSRDNGIWVALSDPAHTPALKTDFPALRNIEMFDQRAFADWLNLPSTGDSFEESALGLCQLIAKRDARIGKVPKGRKKRASSNR